MKIKITGNFKNIAKEIDKNIDTFLNDKAKEIIKEKEAEDKKKHRYKPNKYKVKFVKKGGL